MIAREATYAALAARMQSACRQYLARDVLRRLVPPPSVGEQPMMCVIATTQEQHDSYDPARPPWLLNATIVIYAASDVDITTSAETALHTIVEAACEALKRQGTEANIVNQMPKYHQWTTLGGLCVWARPGVVEFDSGEIGQQGVAMIPVEMLVPQT